MAVRHEVMVFVNRLNNSMMLLSHAEIRSVSHSTVEGVSLQVHCYIDIQRIVGKSFIIMTIYMVLKLQNHSRKGLIIKKSRRLGGDGKK